MLQCEAINGPRPYFEVSMNDVARVEVLGDFEQLVHNVLLVDRLQDARLGGRVEVCVCVEASVCVCVCVCVRVHAYKYVCVYVVCKHVWRVCVCARTSKYVWYACMVCVEHVHVWVGCGGVG